MGDLSESSWDVLVVKSSLDHLLHSDRDHWRFYNCDVLCHFKGWSVMRDGYTIRSFFKSFKDNFKQATAIWLIFLAVGLILGFDLYFCTDH